MMSAQRRWLLIAALIAAAITAPTAPALAASADTAVVIGFSPANGDVGAEDVVLQSIALAKQRIHIAMYKFTSRRIANALIEARARGVEVAVVIDPDNSTGPRGAIALMQRGGIAIRRNDHYTHMHHKFMVIDGRHLQTGSYNYTYGATSKNAENALLLRDVPKTAAAYEREWQRLWGEATR